MITMQELKFRLNGKDVQVDVRPDETLLQVLRERLRLTGTKVGCGEGECGACTVLVEGRPVDSCLYPALRCQGLKVETVEGLAGEKGLHPLQDAFIQSGAVQCGFCTPGMLMSAKALLDQDSSPSREDITQALAGNLCRCTGYLKIIEAVEDAARKIRDTGDA
jgi:carbon-monoxide dehydrogenase small subunit